MNKQLIVFCQTSIAGFKLNYFIKMDIITTESVIKLEQDQDWSLLKDNLCFICLQSISPTNNKTNTQNFLFNYLKISDIKKTIVCGKCEETLAKLVKLFSDLEKVQLEIDYFLGFIQNTILNASKDRGKANGLESVRESFAEKCGEKIKFPKAKVILEDVDDKFTKMPVSDDLVGSMGPARRHNADKYREQTLNLFPKVILKRLDVSSLIKRRSETSISDYSDGPPNLDDDDYSNSSLIKSRFYLQTPHPSVLNVEMGIIKKEVNCDSLSAPSAISKDNSCNTPVLDAIQTIKIESKSENITSKAKTKCPRCYKTFRNPENLRKHYKATHLRLKPKVKCPKCLKSFTTRQSLHKHIDAHHSHLNPYKCDLCDESFAYFKAFKSHKQTDYHKSKQNAKPLHCDICDKTFDHFKALNWHKRDVHPKKLFPCQICGKMFKRKLDMKDHFLSVHEKRREFYCQVEGCDCRYFKPRKLAMHYRLKHPDFSVPPKAKKEPAQSSIKGNPENVKVDEIFKEIRIINLDDI